MNDASTLTQGGVGWGLIFAYVGSKIFTRRSLLEFSCLTNYPIRTLSLFFYGVGFAGFINLQKISEDKTFVNDYQFKRRVEENRRAEGTIENIRHKIDTVVQNTPNN